MIAREVGMNLLFSIYCCGFLFFFLSKHMHYLTKEVFFFFFLSKLYISFWLLLAQPMTLGQNFVGGKKTPLTNSTYL